MKSSSIDRAEIERMKDRMKRIDEGERRVLADYDEVVAERDQLRAEIEQLRKLVRYACERAIDGALGEVARQAGHMPATLREAQDYSLSAT